jgi:hypothetical protein
MKSSESSQVLKTSAQGFKNGEIHDWYRTVWGYSDHLVGDLLDEFASQPKSRILDPFCGTGTTLVECMKRGVDSAGIDANPVSCFAARVKTNWHIEPLRLTDFLESIEQAYLSHLETEEFEEDPTYEYIDETGMLERGWISDEPLKKAICLKRAIQDSKTNAQYQNVLMLALLDTVIRTAANVKFGPELYCGKQKADAEVFPQFSKKVCQMAGDLNLAKDVNAGQAIVVKGDSRDCRTAGTTFGTPQFSLVICSPPYPCEHDYTRNSRLELAFLEQVKDRESLRQIKKEMVRSHTKGIYLTDSDSDLVAGNDVLQRLAKRIDHRAAQKTHGFARLYSRVLTEYFGGMKRHLTNLRPLLQENAILAYVVGDQSSYLQVPVRTAKILGSIATEVGYDLIEIRHWRNRQSTSTSKVIVENILILQRKD